ncbi:MAG: thiolase family protein [Dehalococcoidia bacterium]
MRDVAIVGVGMIPFGRYPEMEAHEMGAKATLDALKDAGTALKDIQLLVCGQLFGTSGAGQRMLKEIGQTGIPVVNTANACATGSTAFREGYFAIASEMYDAVLVVGQEKMGSGVMGGDEPPGGERPEGFVGSGTMPALFAMAGMEHMRKYGTTQEQFAKVAVKAKKHAAGNPYAKYRDPATLDEVLNARMISYPNTMLMCCPNTDGAAAAVLMPMAKARQYTSQPIRVAASILTSDPWTERDLALLDINTLTRNAARQAYETAGVGPEDLDLVELHDCFATAELLHYENLGLCGDGEAGRFIDEEATYIGGRIPVNASGGLLSKGHPLGATGVANIVEVTWHLRGQAGQRQVENAKVGLAHVIGIGAACTVHILKK